MFIYFNGPLVFTASVLRHSLCCILLDCLYSLLDFLHSILCVLNYTLHQYCIFYGRYLSLHCTIWHMLMSACTPVTTSAQCLIRHFHCLQILLEHLYLGDKKTITLTLTANRIGSKSAHLSTISPLTLPHTLSFKALCTLWLLLNGLRIYKDGGTK